MNSGGISAELLKREIPEGNPQTQTDSRRAQRQTAQRRVVVVCVITKHTGTVNVYEDLKVQAVMTVFTSIREKSVKTSAFDVVFSD